LYCLLHFDHLVIAMVCWEFLQVCIHQGYREPFQGRWSAMADLLGFVFICDPSGVGRCASDCLVKSRFPALQLESVHVSKEYNFLVSLLYWLLFTTSAVLMRGWNPGT
jgi:hypothetical protein